MSCKCCAPDAGDTFELLAAKRDDLGISNECIAFVLVYCVGFYIMIIVVNIIIYQAQEYTETKKNQEYNVMRM